MILKSDQRYFLADLENAIRTLEEKLGPDAPFIRPFICDGPPTDCDVFIVGVNPRENMPFRPYWDGGEYNKREWEKDYLWQRYKRALADMAQGLTPKDIVSRTRRKIEAFSAGALPFRVLETNVYPTASADKHELNRPHRDDSIFRLLVDKLRPRVVITHGADARKCILRLGSDANVPSAISSKSSHEFVKLQRLGSGSSFHFLALKHLSGRSGTAYGYQWMHALGVKVRELLSS